MEVAMYPGCTFSGTAREYRESVETVAQTLGVEFRELQDWTCCGASSAHVLNDRLAIALPARDLLIADKTGLDLVTPCAACFLRLKYAEKYLKQGKPIDGISGTLNSDFHVKPLVDYFWEDVGEKALTEKVKKPLDALNPVCYYGCLTARPPKITDSKNPENPQEMDRLLKSLGANVRNWSFKSDCCGGNLALTRPDLQMKLTQKLLDMAEEAGADCIAVSCPMRHLNLDSKQTEISQESGKSYNIPIFYFSELMGLAFGSSDVATWLSRHHVDGRALLKEKGLLVG